MKTEPEQDIKLSLNFFLIKLDPGNVRKWLCRVPIRRKHMQTSPDSQNRGFLATDLYDGYMYELITHNIMWLTNGASRVTLDL